MNKKILSLLGIIFIFFFINKLYASEKFAFIDLNYIYSNSKVGKKIINETQKKQKIINKEFKDFQKKLDEEKNNLMSQKNVLDEEELKKKLSNLEANLKNYNQILSKKNKDLADFQNKHKNEFIKTLNKTLEIYAKENSISLIFRKENLLIGKNNLDVTKDILEPINKS